MKKLLLTLALTLLAKPCFAIGMVTIDPKSPLISDIPIIQDVYYQSCKAGSKDNLLSSNDYPMTNQDILTDKFNKKYPPGSFHLWNQMLLIVSAGYDFGRTLALTDLGGDYIDSECKDYAHNFAVGIIDDPQNWSLINETPNLSPDHTMIPDPLNDILAPKQTHHLHVTPVLAQQNGCRYMYVTLSYKPVIDVSPLDATLDLMENMIWADYDKDVIRNAYQFLLKGAKQGQYLFNTHQSIQKCYVN